MKAAPLLISWHNETSPIYSTHFEPHGKGRLATAGGDTNVRLWNIETSGEERKVTYLSTLKQHTQSVNVVRFSPKGEKLASAGDDGNVLIWVPSEMPNLGEEHAEDKEHWRVKHMCRSSTGAEIYDLAWSPDSVFIITGGVDNTARIFNAQTGALIRQIAEHNHYIQGVAWDPLNEFVATQSSDRSVHIYTLKLKDGTCTLSAHGKFHKMDLPARRISSNSPAPTDFGHRPSNASVSVSIASPAPSNPGTPVATPLPMDPPAPMSQHSRRSSFGSSPSFRRSASPAPSLPLPAVRPEISSPSLNAAMGIGIGVKNANIYHNETLTSFFRRLTFAHDGSLLFTPAGHYKTTHPLATDPTRMADELTNTVYIYTRAGFNKPPVAHLPGHKKPSVVVRCSPVFYTLRQGTKPTTNITIDTSSGIDEIPALPEPIVPTTNASTFMEPPPREHSNSVTSDARPLSSPRPSDPDITGSGIGPASAFSLPYRMVYAVATQDAVFVYDTQQTTPLCVVSNLHYATFSDLTWSTDGLTLLMSSTDGFCSTLAFTPGELGSIYTGHHPTLKHPQPLNLAAIETTSNHSTPVPTPTATVSPALPKASPIPVPPAHPSPMAPTFNMRPGSPARSNSQSSIATISSLQTSAMTNNPTPTLSHVPLVTATNPSTMVGLPLTTPPQTPMAGYHSATSSISGSVLGKRDVGAASESEKEDAGRPKKRRVAPQLVSMSSTASVGQAPSIKEA